MTLARERTPVGTPRLSVISFCLNSAPFLRATIESVLRQTFGEFELVMKDGGSTDGTLDILKEYPQIRYWSEKEGGDNPTLDAIWQAFNMSRGDYIIYLAVSDGLTDRDWFRKCVAVLDSDQEVSWVWGLPQHLSEEGNLGAVVQPEYLRFAPPQKKDFLPLWLASGQMMESNACFRRQAFQSCFPTNDPDDPYRFHSTLGFNYNLNTSGYLPWFVPTVSYFGRSHGSQIQEKQEKLLDAVSRKYTADIIDYRKKLLAGRVSHHFRDGRGQIIGQIRPEELRGIQSRVWNYRLKNKIRRDLQKLLDHISY